MGQIIDHDWIGHFPAWKIEVADQTQIEANQAGKYTVTLTGDTETDLMRVFQALLNYQVWQWPKQEDKELNSLIKEQADDIEQLVNYLHVERENADKLAKMLRYIVDNDETMKHEILLLGTETTLGDIVDGMLLRHEKIVAEREEANE